MSAEIVHANLLRDLTGGTTASKDPVQTFYFPTGTFDNLTNFLPILLALENAFIGAYLTAVHEFSEMAARIEPYEREQKDPTGKAYKRVGPGVFRASGVGDSGSGIGAPDVGARDSFDFTGKYGICGDQSVSRE